MSGAHDEQEDDWRSGYRSRRHVGASKEGGWEAESSFLKLSNGPQNKAGSSKHGEVWGR